MKLTHYAESLSGDKNPINKGPELRTLFNYMGQSGSCNRRILLWHYGKNEWDNGPRVSSGVDNNGNVRRAHHFAPLDDAVGTRALRFSDYLYDNLNRITRATEYLELEGYVEQYKQSYGYDR